MTALLLTRWQRDVLAGHLRLTEDEIDGLAQLLDGLPDPREPCSCSRMPWNPHRHRYTLSWRSR